jgi:hypothetical protein
MPLRPLRIAPLFLLVGCAPTLAPAPPAPVESVPGWDRVETVAPGVRHLFRADSAGPWAVHVVEANPRTCGVELGTVKAAGRLEGRETTGELARRAERERGRPVLAALNADFFSFTPPGVPTGAQVVAGEPVRGPGERAVLGVAADGTPFIGRVRLAGKLWLSQGLSATVGRVNMRPAGDTLAVYNHFAGATTPTDTGVVELLVRRVGAAGAVGDTLRGVLVGSDTAAAGVAVPEGGVVFAARGRAADFLRLLTPPGDTVRWTLRLEPAPGPVREMVGGHPVLLRRGAEVPDAESGAAPAFAATRHPRSAVGWRADGTLLLVAVDGRQPGYSVGMSLPEMRALFRELGAVEALNLDGGGSTALVVRGRAVNRPSDAGGERPVANALVLLGPAPGSCGRR